MPRLPAWTAIPCLLALLATGPATAAAQIRIKVGFQDRRAAAALERLGLRGDFRTGGRAAGTALLSATPEELRRLAEAGFRYEILDGRRGASAVPPEAVIAEMNRLAAAFPTLCVKRVFGKSVNGVELSALKISDNAAQDEAEPEILFDGGIHGNESVGSDLILRFANDILTGYAGNAAIKNLIDTREIWLYCMVNPDGREKTRENANRIDLNRDYGYMKVKAFTQPETRAVRDCLLGNHFTLQFSYHSGVEYLLYPWCFSQSPTPDKAIHVAVADLYSTSSAFYDKSKNVQSYFDYPTEGETIDYSYGTAGTAALTVEMTTEQGGTLQQKYYDANRPAMLKMIESAGFGLEGTITDAKTGKGVAATVFVSGYYPLYSDPRLGDYRKFVPAGSYSLKVIANGYATKTLPGVVAQNGAAVRADLQLDPDPASLSTFAYKVVYAEAGTGITPNVLGRPDNLTFSGVVAADMQFQVGRKAGNEFKVHVAGATATYTCSVSPALDGPWTVLGTAQGTAEFDMPNSGPAAVQYLKVEGGAAVDAIEALQAPPVSIAAAPPGVIAARPGMPADLLGVGRFGWGGTGKSSLRVYDARGRLLWQSRPAGLPAR